MIQAPYAPSLHVGESLWGVGMLITGSIEEVRGFTRALRSAGKRVGFVPTMGYLHEGHMSLIDRARSEGTEVVASIFVNPTQFNNREDFEKYPIDLNRDTRLLSERGVSLLFTPTPKDIYGPSNAPPTNAFQSWVTVDALSVPWEGAMRPGHFRGVTTVVSILFNIVQPDLAVFGEKDFQQLRLIEKMVDDLKLPISIVRGTLVREADGLAMSSRNVRLSSEARRDALLLSRGLFAAQTLFEGGERDPGRLTSVVREMLGQSSAIKVEYVACVSEHDLSELSEVNRPARLLVAAVVGGVRLIDNIGLVP